MEKISDELDRSTSWLYETAKVARLWPKFELEQMLRWQPLKGKRVMTWDHLAALAQVEDPTQRLQHGMAIEREGLSAKALRLRIHPERVEPIDETPDNPGADDRVDASAGETPEASEAVVGDTAGDAPDAAADSPPPPWPPGPPNGPSRGSSPRPIPPSPRPPQTRWRTWITRCGRPTSRSSGRWRPR